MGSPTGLPLVASQTRAVLSSPWLTIAYASARLRPGDTLYARGGTYTGQGDYCWKSPSGTSTAPITFKAYPGETPVFDGGMTIGSFIVLTGNIGCLTQLRTHFAKLGSKLPVRHTIQVLRDAYAPPSPAKNQD